MTCALRVAAADGFLLVITPMDDLDRVKWLADYIDHMKARGVMPPEFTPPRSAVAGQEDHT
jgi:hypothetical protein